MNAKPILKAGLLCALGILGCKPNDTADDFDPNRPTAELIQTQIFDKKCAISGCHSSASDANFSSHELLLTASESRTQLLEVLARNPAARAEGLKRIHLLYPDSSFLLHKLHVDQDHHSGQNYGNVMPLGLEPLSAGQIEYIRQWIIAGAPQTGIVANVDLLRDNTPQDETFTPPPALSVSVGYQVRIPKFAIQPNSEREVFINSPIGNSQDAYISRVEVFQRNGSHHLVLYGFRDPSQQPPVNRLRDLHNPDGSTNIYTNLEMSNHVFWAGGTVTDGYTYQLPPGLALKIPANGSLDFNSHYVNRTGGERYGEVYVNLYTMPSSQVQHEVKALDLNNFDIELPPNTRTTTTKDFLFDRNVKIIMLTSHMHQYGERFEIRIKGGARDGELVYTTNSWEHPDIVNFSTPISIRAGEGLTSTVTYNNTTNQTLYYGLTSADEMNIIFGYYYEE